MQTQTNPQPQPTLDLAKLQEIVDNFPPDPLATWMRHQGFDPHLGGMLVLPPEMATHLGPFIPGYVKLSKMTDRPVLIWAPGVQRPEVLAQEPR